MPEVERENGFHTAYEQEQHKDVHTFLDKFLTAIRAAQKDKAEFDAVKLKELVLSAKDALVYYELQFWSTSCTNLACLHSSHILARSSPIWSPQR